MWYTRGHENTSLYPTTYPRRTAPDPGGIAFVRCLCVASLPDLTGLCPWGTSPDHSPPAWVRRPDPAQRDPRLQCLWAGCPAGRVVASLLAANDLFRRRSRAPQRPLAPQPT